MNLLIVESPAKSRTLKKFLGRDYEIGATLGHIRDLPKKKISIDIDKDFEPTYRIIPGKKTALDQLKKQAKKAKQIWLASVDYEEPILIQGPDGLIHLFRTGAFINEALTERINFSLYKIPAFNLKTQKIQFESIKGVSRHPIKKNVLEIILDYGRKIKITPSHSVFTKDKTGKIKSVFGKNLRIGDGLLVPLKLPRSSRRIKKIDLLKAIYHNDRFRQMVFINSPRVSQYRKEKILRPRTGSIPQFQPRLIFSSGLKRALKRKRQTFGWSQKFLADKINCSQSNICDWEKGRKNPILPTGKIYLEALGFNLKKVLKNPGARIVSSSIETAIKNAIENQWRDSRKGLTRTWQPLGWFDWQDIEKNFKGDGELRISRHNHSHLMPRFVTVNKDLMLFLGFFIAEGSFLDKKKYLRFSFGKKEIGGEKENIQRVKGICKRLFNLSPIDIEEKTTNALNLKSTLVTFLVKNILGVAGRAESKEVPWIVYNVPPPLQLAFLEGFFLGDGSLDENRIVFNTVSPKLAEGIRFLLLQNGISTSHHLAFSKKPNRKPNQQVVISGKEKLLKTKEIWKNHYRAEKLNKYLKTRNRIKKNFSLVKNQKEDLGLLKIRSIKKTSPSKKFVYDFSVKGENFICGNGGICAHNTDPDREGEAIAWHTVKALGLGQSYQRIVFHEITQEAVLEAFKHPRKINMDLVNAQQARRILDRVVGYKLSPLLWRKITRGLSAGRVQSVALRLISEREKEIKAFIPQEYWSIEALLRKKDDGEFEASLIQKGNKKIPRMGIKTKDQAQKIIEDLKGADWQVENIETKRVKKNPPEPFTTSTLQQEAWKRFRWPAEMTMSIAQKLYEQGLITYHRSDSLNLSAQSLKAAEKVILEKFGKQYWPGAPRKFKTKSKTAQEAHEAVRPTSPEKIPEQLETDLDHRQAQLYELVWSRFMACQMSEALFDATLVDIKAKNYIFRASGQILRFDGFLKVYPMRYEEAELPEMEKGEILLLKKLASNQHITQPPPRFSEATLIKELEKNGVGRPSTYASIISVIQKRNYVKKDDKKKFFPTEIGTTVSDFLIEHFSQIVDIGFTAEMENNLDQVANGKKQWTGVLREFYDPFEKNLKEKTKEIKKQVETTDKQCPDCGSPLVVRMSRFGKFYGCSGYPKCKFTQPLANETLGIKCPKCKKGEITEKRSKKGKVFYGCNLWPKCDYALWNKPTGETCPECGSLLVQNPKGEINCSNDACNFSP